jgi:GntR family transcriptional regulator of abcA and norABC
MWHFAEQDSGPLYLKIIRLIESNIASGKLLVGEKLPPERQLAQMLGVNRSTVVRAFDELAERGVLIRKRGSGTVINQEKWGVSAKPSTNWRHYVDQGGFNPVSPYIRRTDDLMKRYPGKLLDLANGELPLDLAPKITMPAYSWQELLAEERSEDITGYFPLKETISRHLKKDLRISALPEQILITSGAQQALFIISQCLLRPGDTIAVESPSYFYALPLFQSAGLRILALPMDNDGVIPEELERLCHRFSLKMIFLNPTFQNPTGLTMPLRRRQDIIALCAKWNLPIVEDNSYSQLHFNESALIPPLKQLDEQNVLYIGSLSKVTGSMTRIGWLVGPAAVVKRLAEARQEMDFGLSIFPQVLANHVFSSPIFDRHLNELRKTLKQRRDFLVNALRSSLAEQIDFSIPQGGFHLWCRLNKEKNINRLVDRLMQQKMLVMPAAIFGSKEQAIRLTFARLEQVNAKLAVKILKQEILREEA